MWGELPPQSLQSHANGIEWVSDLMGNPGGEVAKRRKALCQTNPIFELFHPFDVAILVYPDDRDRRDSQEKEDKD